MPLATNLYVHYNDTRATKPYLKKYGKVSFERLNPFINPWFWRLYKFWKKNFDFSSKEKILLVLPDFLNNLFLFKVKNIRWILSTFCSMVKLCRDNPLVPFTVCHPNFCQSNEKMDKIIRLSVCLSGRVLPLKRLFIHPCSNIYSKIDNSSSEKYFPKLRLARGLDAAHTGCTSRRRFDAKWEITEIWIIFQKIFPQNHRNLNNLSLNILKITKIIFQNKTK